MLDIAKELDEFGTGGKVLSLTAGIDFSKSFKRAGDVRDSMMHGFKHGKKHGETTFIKALDPHFKWKPGFLYCITGWPQHGKTEFTQYLALIKAVYEGKKWAFHSPENYPEDEFFDALAHSLVGKSTDPRYPNQMTEKEYDQAIDFLHEHFFYVYQEGAAHTPEYLREAYAYIHAEFGLYGTVSDPWNKLAHIKNGMRDDEYLAYQLPLEQKQGREYDLVKMILAHPRSPGPLQKGEALPVPNQYNLAGGQMWDNMCDVIGATYRPNYHLDKTDTFTEFHTHKIKKQQLVGYPGRVEFNFNRQQARYFDMDEGCALVPHIAKPAPPPDGYIVNKLPDSTFDQETEAPF